MSGLNILINHVLENKPVCGYMTETDVFNLVQDWFDNVTWSLEKDEWVNHLTQHEKMEVCRKILSEVYK